MTEFKEKNNVKGVVLGLSGGKDSTVVAMLAIKVFGKDSVLPILMPNGNQADIQDSLDIHKTLWGDKEPLIVNIQSAYDSIILQSVPVIISDKAKTNIPPRIRMTVEYAIAQSLGYLVIGTGNASETYIGWSTKFGDSACDFNPIANLTCSEVKQIGLELAKEFGLSDKFINKTPSDGLTMKSDESNFGFTYDELDNYLLNGVKSDNYSKIENMHKWSEHKRKFPANPLND